MTVLRAFCAAAILGLMTETVASQSQAATSPVQSPTTSEPATAPTPPAAPPQSQPSAQGPTPAAAMSPTVPAPTTPPTTTTPGAQATAGTGPRQAATSQFQTRILAGGATNALELDVQPADLPRLGCSPATTEGQAEVLSKAPRDS
jgi:hypothetical protein